MAMMAITTSSSMSVKPPERVIRACPKNPTEVRSLRFGVPPLGGSGAVPPKGGTPNAIFRHVLKIDALRKQWQTSFMPPKLRIHIYPGAVLSHFAKLEIIGQFFKK